MAAKKKTKASDDAASMQVRKYLAAQPPRTRVTLKKMRETILASAPGAVEAFSYRIPAVKLEDKALVWYAGFANHTSLYPIGDAIKRKYAKDLAGYETSKGTVRFPLDKALPVALVKRLVKARIDEMRGKG